MTSADIILAVMTGVSLLTSQAALFFALYVFLRDKKVPLVSWEELNAPNQEELDMQEALRKRQAAARENGTDLESLRKSFEELIRQ